MKVRIAISVLIFSQAFLAAQNKKLTMEEMHQLHQDSKAYIAYLEDPQRDVYQKPHEVIMALGLREGETVADIGAGSGYFTFRLASPVGEKGRIYAVDTSPDMIVHMNHQIRDMKLRNIVTVLSAPDDPLLMDGSIDRFFICDTWHHIQNQAQYLALMKKMLKPGGQVIMIDFQKRELPVGAPMEMKIAREDLVRQMESNGFKLVKEHTFLPYQYFLIFTSR
ncbi:MAG: class I SAM-dependent methyltransferase [Acidobacteriota bacterium]